jgi:hypothetical protein
MDEIFTSADRFQHSSMAAKAKIKTREQKRKSDKEVQPEVEPF